jgi:hypothetical protein
MINFITSLSSALITFFFITPTSPNKGDAAYYLFGELPLLLDYVNFVTE